MIGINYVGTEDELEGCHQDVENIREFLGEIGYPDDEHSQVIMRDDPKTDLDGPTFPNGHNMLAAMQWLVSEPGTCNFLHYSGHGGQIPDEDGDRASGLDDTIIPYDFRARGQLKSSLLHQTLITCLPPSSTLLVVFDCCHSGSALELPYVYMSDENGNVSVMDNYDASMRLLGDATRFIKGGFGITHHNEAKALLAGAQAFFTGLMHQDNADQYGLGQENFGENWASERKNVWMYSGCRDDQTSADADIDGSHVGAMSYAFLTSMRHFGPQQSFMEILQNTRQILKGKYEQVPQLSVGRDADLHRALIL